MTNKRIQTTVFSLMLIAALPASTTAKDRLAKELESQGCYKQLWQ